MTALRFGTAAFFTLMLALFVAACSSPPPADPGAGSTTSRPSDSAKPPVTDTADPVALDLAVDVAVGALTAFADHDRSYDDWWASLSPFLDAEALQAYAYTDPRLVPPSHVTGPGIIAAAVSSTQVTVLVPTDAGQYRVELFRQVDGGSPGPWLVNSMTPPEL